MGSQSYLPDFPVCGHFSFYTLCLLHFLQAIFISFFIFGSQEREGTDLFTHCCPLLAPFLLSDQTDGPSEG